MTDVSKNVVAVLLVLVILVSGFGTWSLLTHDTGVAVGNDASGAAVGVQIHNPPKTDATVSIAIAGSPSNG